MFSWLTFPWNNTAEGNSLLTNPRSGSLFLGVFSLFVCYFRWQLICFPSCTSLSASLCELNCPFPFPLSLVFPLSSSFYTEAFVEAAFLPHHRSQYVLTAPTQGGTGRKAALPRVQGWSFSFTGTVPCCSRGLEGHCYKQGFLPGEEEKAKRLGVSWWSK